MTRMRPTRRSTNPCHRPPRGTRVHRDCDRRRQYLQDPADTRRQGGCPRFAAQAVRPRTRLERRAVEGESVHCQRLPELPPEVLGPRRHGPGSRAVRAARSGRAQRVARPRQRQDGLARLAAIRSARRTISPASARRRSKSSTANERFVSLRKLAFPRVGDRQPRLPPDDRRQDEDRARSRGLRHRALRARCHGVRAHDRDAAVERARRCSRTRSCWRRRWPVASASDPACRFRLRSVRPRYCHHSASKERHRAVHASDPRRSVGLGRDERGAGQRRHGRVLRLFGRDPRGGHLRRRQPAAGPRGGAHRERARRPAASSRTARSPRPRSSSPATTSSTAPRSIRPSTPPRASRAPASARSRCARRADVSTPPPLQREAIGWLYREWFGRAVGVLARSVGDLDLAEEMRPGRLRHGARALAAGRLAGRPRRLDHPHGAQPRDRPSAAAAAGDRARAPGGRSRGAAPRDRARARLVDPGRAARADVRVLPPVARARGERRAHAAPRRRASRSRRSPARCSPRRRRSRSGSCAPSARCARGA